MAEGNGSGTEQGVATPVTELDPYTIELSRGQKGTYGWTFKVRGRDKDKVLSECAYIDSKLREKYPTAV